MAIKPRRRGYAFSPYGARLETKMFNVQCLVMDDRDNHKPIWCEPPHELILSEDGVHIWRANLALPTVEIARLTSFLSSDEIARANKFKFEIHKTRFIAARGILRELLANYLQINPLSLEFSYSDRGKPYLASSISSRSLQFNLSHSQDYALYGFTRYRPIGVDLEYLREMRDVVKIAERFFSSQEFELIASLSNEEQQTTFFKLWTAKEAYLKATGEGLSGSLDKIAISLTPESRLSLLSVKGDGQAAANWLMTSFIPTTDYVAAVAIETSTPQQNLKFWRWN
ncbi:MAG: 4'-phosphopantetheinyl transferase superfamily protein [Pleurocapsa sp.]